MYPRRMMVVGVMLVIAAIALGAVTPFMIGEEEQLLKKAVRYEGGGAGAARQGGMVVVEGKVNAKNKILIFDFVDAAKEHNDQGSWGILETYRQPVIVDLAQGGIVLNSQYVCTRPEGKNIVKTNEITPNKDPIRYEGLRRGDPITAVGTLTSLNPAALKVQNWYSGSIAEYRDSLATNKRHGYFGSALIFLLGAGLFFRGSRKR